MSFNKGFYEIFGIEFRAKIGVFFKLTMFFQINVFEVKLLSARLISEMLVNA